MHIYYFVKYNSRTTLEHLIKCAETGAVLCFDFEDSIHNWINPENTSELKQHYRNTFRHIANNLIPEIPGLKIGVRINANQKDIVKDIDVLANLKIHSILIPKVEKSEQIETLEKQLYNANVLYDELIPIMESRNGINNLPIILSSFHEKIDKIGFGHCDYNMSIQKFPFFHQNSTEYWKWINRIHSIVSQFDISYINSAFLDLKNDSFFYSILYHLEELFGEKAGQFTLTHNQSVLGKTFKNRIELKAFDNLVGNNLDLSVPKGSAEKLILNFENDNKGIGFTVLGKTGLLISPHEYNSAKKHLEHINLPKVNFTFVGGCFPVQHNILFEDLFHQKLRNEVERTFNIEFNVNIIRYERFTTCLNKIVEYHKTHPVDVLVFHIRPEPYLRSVKFYYKYLNSSGKLKHSLNIPLMKTIKSEKYDFLELGRRYNLSGNLKKSWLHKKLIDLNYLIGKVIGNSRQAKRKYFNLILDIQEYCKKAGVTLIILGPAYRSNTTYEPGLCKELNNHIKNLLVNIGIAYIDCLEKYSGDKDSYFYDNGIHAKESFHELVAKKLASELKRNLGKTIFPGKGLFGENYGTYKKATSFTTSPELDKS